MQIQSTDTLNKDRFDKWQVSWRLQLIIEGLIKLKGNHLALPHCSCKVSIVKTSVLWQFIKGQSLMYVVKVSYWNWMSFKKEVIWMHTVLNQRFALKCQLKL